MITINLEPVVVHTIYAGGRKDEEDYARRHPDASAVALMQDKRMVEAFTFLEVELAHQFMEIQKEWLAKPGNPNLLVSDMLRPLAQQIKCHRNKPGLAAIPGTSLHGLGCAFDYDTGNLGANAGGEPYTFKDFHNHLKDFGWQVHPRAFRDPRHAEAWHAQPTKFMGISFQHKNELFAKLREDYQHEVMGHEEEYVHQVAGVLGVTGYPYQAQVQAIQRLVGIRDDGIVGPVTRGYLTLLTVKYQRNPSTMDADSPQEVANADAEGEDKTEKVGGAAKSGAKNAKRKGSR